MDFPVLNKSRLKNIKNAILSIKKYKSLFLKLGFIKIKFHKFKPYINFKMNSL
ncbi:hypothetical protein A8938_1973 [Algoriphagus zhangzhouensis]|uniref:Uncharacterized protein n=1 Tax=Algoriphagus zhangzhouensis TaxID=1073327 RepID=A0A1M7Z985_9BACT|nr:hypothetical protein A8938_1973 [Algoriphagus zhangzhouensis]SHO61362.1 hypothetical protein SAMN04488108_1290 [Algoriphagus zhangzhouensis]